MARRTKKVGSTGRFGPRYGLNVRRRVRAIEQNQNKDHACPQCLMGNLKRVSTAIWECPKCDHKFAGGAYVPHTGSRERTRGEVKVSVDAEMLEEVQEALQEEAEEDESVTEEVLTEETAEETAEDEEAPEV